MRTPFAVVSFAAAALLAAPEPAVTGLDHIPIAVRDLARAAGDYRALGFALKPGVPHGNGIRNQHVKFTDGTELELITAPEARDALTRTYRRHLEQGDGPAFLALFAPRRSYAAERLNAAKIDLSGAGLGYLFLGGRNASPTDRPEHFAHANTAQSLIRVWLAPDDPSRERRVLEALGATVADADVRVPAPMRATVARLTEGDVVLLPRVRQIAAGRPIIGATLRVGSVDRARAILDRGQRAALDIVVSNAGRSVFLPPERTHGLWLEFFQPTVAKY